MYTPERMKMVAKDSAYKTAFNDKIGSFMRLIIGIFLKTFWGCIQK